MHDISASLQSAANRRRYYFRGVRAAFSVPGLILASAFVGFAGLAREAGLTLAETVFMTGVVWALPGKVVLVGAILSGASLPAAAFAVALSSVRLMPMVVALVPEMRGPAHAEMGALRPLAFRRRHLLGASPWSASRGIPRSMRTSYYVGLGSTLVLGQHGGRGCRLPGRRQPAAVRLGSAVPAHADVFPDLAVGLGAGKGRACRHGARPWCLARSSI